LGNIYFPKSLFAILYASLTVMFIVK